MCGVAGLIHLQGGRPDEGDERQVVAMCRAIAHRGPDDQGRLSVGPACIGSVRLSILDLSPAGHMPMASGDGRWSISYNGELYNYVALRRELVERGHEFRSQTDTEVVLHAFAEWGTDALARFNGMFAFAVMDRETGTLTLVRDRFGIKPMYYLQREGRLYFSSEVKSFLTLPQALPVNRQSLLEWSLYNSVDAFTSESLLEGVHTLLPGEWLQIQQGQLRRHTYYSPPERVVEGRFRRRAADRPEAVIADIEAALKTSVERRLVADVPVGCLLSGGLDSSLITALARKTRQDLMAFHVSVQGHPDLDESPHARLLAGRLGIEMVTFPLTAEAFRRELVRGIHALDFPLRHANTIAYALICQEARKRGVKVLLSGEGADELFGGYAFRYRRYRSYRRVSRLLERLPRKLRNGVEILGYLSAKLPVHTMRFEEQLPLAVAMLDRFSRSEWLRRCEAAYAFVPGGDERALLGLMLGDLVDFLSPLLRRLDRMSMDTSVECRVPFLDHEVVEHAIHLPLDYRMGKRSDKWILKQIAAAHLPTQITARKKMGFPVPLAEYLAPFADASFFAGGFCSEVLELRPHAIRQQIESFPRRPQAFLTLVSWELWGRLFVYREAPAQVDERVRALEHHHAT